ncbi:MAG: amino acid adenylation domain-containing protein [Bacteroidota bacterium]
MQNPKITFTSSAYEAHRSFWTAHLANAEENFVWKDSTIQPGSQEAGHRKTAVKVLSEAAQQSLQRLGGGKDMETMILLFSALAHLMARHSRSEYIVVDAPLLKQAEMEMIWETRVPVILPAMAATVKDQIIQTDALLRKSFQYQNAPFEIIANGLELPATNTAFTFKPLAQNSLKSADYDLHFQVERKTEGQLAFSIDYVEERFSASWISELLNQYERILEAYANPTLSLNQLNILSAEERRKLDAWEQGAVVSATVDSLIDQIRNMAEVQPEAYATALCDENGQHNQLTYGTLWRRSNQLARHLQQHMKIEKGDRVAVLMNRKSDLLIAFLAAMKAGAVLVPIAADLPKSRIDFLLEDAAPKALLLEMALIAAAQGYKGQMFAIDVQMSMLRESEEDLESLLLPTDLAYIIYTSGSTGQPKGVQVPHAGLRNYLQWAKETYQPDSPIHLPFFTSVAFDLTLTSLFLPLWTGGKVLIFNADDREMLFKRILSNPEITLLKLTPSHLRAFKFLDFAEPTNLRKLIVGGEALDFSLVKETRDLFGEVLIYNEYGPTEATVGCTCYAIKAGTEGVGAVPIGQPISNMRAIVLDRFDQASPIGAVGELCMAGQGLAASYLNRPEVTAAKFQSLRGERMYRTGDLAFRNAEGQLVYMGRVDRQLKINGFRIELGEIEQVLRSHDKVEDAAVALRSLGGAQLLFAWIVGAIDGLESWLESRLPGYMIPRQWMALDAMPLTKNGKVDYSNLPQIEKEDNVVFMAPESEAEQLIARIWEEILGAEKVGVQDDFFKLGGDSIRAIQLSSRLQQHRYQVDIDDVFNHPTVGALALQLRPLSREVPQTAVEGTVDLGPVHHHFLDQKHQNPAHFNQSVFLKRESGFEMEKLQACFELLTLHHDALRMVLKNGQLFNQAPGMTQFELNSFDLRQHPDPIAEVARLVAVTHQSFDLENGPLFKAVRFQLSKADHCLIVVHHLVMDGVSWRILLEDFSRLYESNQPTTDVLPLKSNSFKDWMVACKDYANGFQQEREIVYWESMEQRKVHPLFPNWIGVPCPVSQLEKTTVKFSEALTNNLLRESNQAYNTQSNDLLLAALNLSLHAWRGADAVVYSMEGHGREPIISDFDISRTIGWFTTLYPMVMATDFSEISMAIRKTKENIRQVPQNGIGYGLLQYLAEKNKRGELQFDRRPEIRFNYLGSFDQVGTNEIFGISELETGLQESLLNSRDVPLLVEGFVLDGCLNIRMVYDTALLTETEMETLTHIFQENLRAVVAHCQGKEATIYTPSDLGEEDLSLDELDAIMSMVEGDE